MTLEPRRKVKRGSVLTEQDAISLSTGLLMRHDVVRENFWPIVCSTAVAIPEACARRDIEAIGKWLESRPATENTFASYRAHIQRFVFWLYVVRGKHLSNLTDVDLQEYVAFLQAIPDALIGEQADFTRTDWTPFRCQPRPSSVKQAMSVINGFLRFSNGNRRIFDAIAVSPVEFFKKANTLDFTESIERVGRDPAAVAAFDRLRASDRTLDAWISSLFLYAPVEPLELRFGRVCDFHESPNGSQLRVFSVDRSRRDRLQRLHPSCEGTFRRHMHGIRCFPSAQEHMFTPLLADKAGNADPPSRSKMNGTLKHGVFALATEADALDSEVGSEIRKLCMHWLAN
ncbi:hypothetical protein [Burkholderia sp. MBR-1]|uniref:hypothetical protein n=1 Tax=Burkholderia sp. MBR-1 TaxID=2732364 RepID=UPI0015EF7BA7|nr:hypothetical protein [Burkholderia sp. MBR-1]QMI49762.1 hypothetical protein MBR110_30270 [Burkholderia sp. MBR-1]